MSAARLAGWPKRVALSGLIATLLLFQAGAAAAFRGELKLQGRFMDVAADGVARSLGIDSHSTRALNLRLMDNGRLGTGWAWHVAGVLDVRQGAGPALTRALYAEDPARYAPLAQRNWWNLQQVFSDHGAHYAAADIDRLNLTYSDAHAVLRLGRQALTWGSGLVFHPMDLFNPFAPNAVDTEYKPGADMLYAQWLFDSGADLQGVLVPRRNPAKHGLAADQSAAGLKWRGFLGANGQYDYQLMLARNYSADVLGLDLSGSLGGATWTAEAIPTRLQDGSLRATWLTNAQYAWTCLARNCNGFAEYFHNGFGVGGSGHTLAGLPAPLNERLARGELFNVSRNYLALGVTIAWTALLNIQPALIANLDDRSALLSLQATRSLSDNLNLILAAQSGIGPHGTEYGGLETAPGSGVYAAPTRYLYARLDWYF